jgi:phosphoribosylanthranilate isomerase
MALKTLVIVNNISNLSDARYCAGMGVEMLGFNIDPASVNYMAPEAFRVITEWVSGVKTVGELQQANAQDLSENLKSYALDYLQIVTSSDWKTLRAVGIPLICKVEWKENFTEALFDYEYAEIAQYIDFFLVHGNSPFMDKKYWEHIQHISRKYPVILGFGITARNVDDLLLSDTIKGIALKGSHEIRPGYKDYEELADVLEAIEVED